MATSMMKQRLIGAAVLIALGIIFIPMLLTGDGKFLSGESDSNVPPKPMYELEAPKVLPLDKRSAQSSEPVPEAAPRSDKTVDQPPASTVADKTTDNTTDKTQTKDSADTKQESAAEAKSTADVNSKPDTSEKQETANKSSVQTPEVEQKVATTVKKKESTPEKQASASAPEEKAATESSTSKESSASKDMSTKKPVVTGWVVQLGSFSVQKNALKLRDSLRKNGHASFVEEYSRNGKKSYRVRVGPEQTRELANELKKKLKTETKLDGFVIEFPGK